MMNRVYLLLGSNLENRPGLLRKAREMIADQVGTIHKQSSIYESEPWGFHAENLFLNQVIEVETEMDPLPTLEVLIIIEKALGRKNRTHSCGYESRTIDIDILLFNHDIVCAKNLEIPHPRLHERLFALLPLGELNENLLHPVIKKTIRQLTEECEDTGKIAVFIEETNH